MTKEVNPVTNEAEEQPVASGNDETVQPVGDVSTEQIDERGVPLQNVVAEERRKRAELEDEVARLKANQVSNVSQYAPPPVYQTPASRQDADPAKKVEKFAGDIDGYLDNYYNERKRKERTAEALHYIAERGHSVQVIDGAIAKYGLSLDDPIRAVKTAEKLLGLEKQKTSNAPARKVDEVREQERIDNIKKTTTDAGRSKPPSPTTDEVVRAKEEAEKYGDHEGVYNFFRKQLDAKDAKGGERT
jgi:hypothetical protein